MDKAALFTDFQKRFQQSFGGKDMTQADFARHSGVDKTIIAQLLNSPDIRLIRMDTIYQLAKGLDVSSDWLLGLSERREQAAHILSQSLYMDPIEDYDPLEEPICKFLVDNKGMKARYVATSILDHFKTPEVLSYETGISLAKMKKIHNGTPYGDIDLGDYDFEACQSLHQLNSFAKGEDAWSGLSPADRKKQLIFMQSKIDKLYPTYKVYLYDDLTYFSVPFTIFGRQTAAVWSGNGYLIFRNDAYVRIFVKLFNRILKSADFYPHEFTGYLEKLLKENF